MFHVTLLDTLNEAVRTKSWTPYLIMEHATNSTLLIHASKNWRVVKRNSTTAPVEFFNEICAKTRNCPAVGFQGISRLRHSEKCSSWDHGHVSIIHVAASNSIVFQNGYGPPKRDSIAISWGRRVPGFFWWKEGKKGRKKERKKRPWMVWLSWLKCHPINSEAMGLIPTQGTCLGCGFGPSQGAYEKQLINISLCVSLSRYVSVSLPPLLLPPSSLPSLPSLPEINRHVLGWGLKKKGREREESGERGILPVSHIQFENSFGLCIKL